MTTFEEMPSIKTAVENEARRRKRVFAMFLALLIIPIAIGAYAIAKAPSETDVLVKSATPIIQKNVEESVTAHVDQQIEPRVDAIVESRATPVIKRTLEKSIAARVGPLEEKYSMRTIQDDTEHQKTEEHIRQLEDKIQQLEKRLDALTPNTRLPVDAKIDRPLTHVPKPDTQ